MNNPFQLFQAIRNPQQFLQQMAGNSQAMSNPILNLECNKNVILILAQDYVYQKYYGGK